MVEVVRGISAVLLCAGFAVGAFVADAGEEADADEGAEFDGLVLDGGTESNNAADTFMLIFGRS